MENSEKENNNKNKATAVGRNKFVCTLEAKAANEAKCFLSLSSSPFAFALRRICSLPEVSSHSCVCVCESVCVRVSERPLAVCA